jgi:hypothetical protein
MAFKKGESGNPAGRKPGSTPGAQIRAAIEQKKDSILKAVIDAAVGGDMTACKMLLDRITPSLKPVAAQVAISYSDGASLSEQAAAVVKSTLSGEVPADVGAMLIRALSEQGKLIELQEMSDRLHRPEKLLESRP